MTHTPEQQLFFIRWAIKLGKKGRLTAPPNPWVGCVIVKDGQIVGEGYHVEPGCDHAEMMALKTAGSAAKGATVFVSLEPCAHHGRTPPCAQALIDAGVAHVVIALIDPDPRVSGRGVELLKAAGIKVTLGLGREEARESLAPYLHHRETKTPYCVLKSAVSLDGKIAAEDTTSQWITGEEARHNAHRLRAESQAILVGSKTALRDRPRLTVRGVEKAIQPLHVLLDRTGSVPASTPLFANPTLVFTSSTCNPKVRKEWEEKGADVHTYETLKEILEVLGSRGILQLLIEGGTEIQAAFLRESLIHSSIIYLGSCLVGGRGKTFLDLPLRTIEEAHRWHLSDVTRFGNDLRLDYTIT